MRRTQKQTQYIRMTKDRLNPMPPAMRRLMDERDALRVQLDAQARIHDQMCKDMEARLAARTAERDTWQRELAIELEKANARADAADANLASRAHALGWSSPAEVAETQRELQGSCQYVERLELRLAALTERIAELEAQLAARR